MTKKYTKLELFTGTYGVMTLLDKDGTAQNIYLDTKNRIPAPKLYYRVILEQSTEPRKGVVVLGINNPHLSLEELKRNGYFICNDISSELSWFDEHLRTNKAVLNLGYLYACEVGDFIKTVTFLPVLNVNGILL